jgi:hypothetical protein
VRAGGAALAVLVVLAVSACGGSRQDAHEPSGKFMVITVKNMDNRALPNPSVTINSFNRNATQANVADPSRPVFVVNTGPHGGETANQNTSAFGRELQPGDTARFVWNVTAVQPGRFTIHYQVSAGLFGKAQAVDASGAVNPTGVFKGVVVQKAPHSTVNFTNGKSVDGG